MYFAEGKYYNYDGSFEGLLTVFNLIFQNSETALDITVQEQASPNLFADIEYIPTDHVAAGGFFQAISQRFSGDIARELIYCFLSETVGVEMLIYQYLCLLFKYGIKYSGNHADATVMKIKRLRLRVSHEIVRFQGFIRFRKLRSGLYYGAFEPSYNIIQLLSPHFKARFADQPWLLHDVRRNSGVIYFNRVCRFVNNPTEVGDISESIALEDPGNREIFDEQEQTYQSLWQDYFSSVAIENRDRRYIQRNCVPERYWKYLVETMGELPLQHSLEREKVNEIIVQTN